MRICLCSPRCKLYVQGKHLVSAHFLSYNSVRTLKGRSLTSPQNERTTESHCKHQDLNLYVEEGMGFLQTGESQRKQKFGKMYSLPSRVNLLLTQAIRCDKFYYGKCEMIPVQNLSLVQKLQGTAIVEHIDLFYILLNKSLLYSPC